MIVYNDLTNRITYVFNGSKADQLRKIIIEIQGEKDEKKKTVKET